MSEKPESEVPSEAEKPIEDPTEIARVMLKAQEPVKDIIRVTGFNEKQIWGIKGAMRRAEKKAREGVPPEGGVYREEADANRILREILEGHPDIGSKQTRELMSWAQLKGQLHPFEVAHLLSNMKGVSTQTANIVSQKYSVSLQKAIQEGKAQIQMPLSPPLMGPSAVQQPFQPIMPFTGQQPQPQSWWGWQTGVQPQPWQPGPRQFIPPQQTPFLTREEYMKTQREYEERGRLDALQERMNELSENFAGALSSLKDEIAEKFRREHEPEEIVHVMEPLRDSEGNVIAGKDGEPVYRHFRGPASQVVSRESELDRILKYQKVLRPERAELTLEDVRKVIKEETKPEPLTPEKVREIMREETKPEKSEAVTKLESRLDAAEKRYDELKGRMEAEDRKRLEGTIRDLRDRLNTIMAGGPGEWKADEMRLLATAVGNLTTIIEKKEPIKTLKEILVPTGMPPAVRGVPPEARRGIIGELERKGMVVER